MTELELKQLLSKITRPDETARTAAHAHWASLAKPLGGLGRLETMLEDGAALTGGAVAMDDLECVTAGIFCQPDFISQLGHRLRNQGHIFFDIDSFADQVGTTPLTGGPMGCASRFMQEKAGKEKPAELQSPP